MTLNLLPLHGQRTIPLRVLIRQQFPRRAYTWPNHISFPDHALSFEILTKRKNKSLKDNKGYKGFKIWVISF